jgi:prepilin peptidase CpaA
MSSLASLSQIAVLLAFVALILWGAFSDFSRFIIPNRVCLAIVALYPAHVLASGGGGLGGPGPVDWLDGALVSGATFAVGAILFALRLAGGGDIKFMTAIMLWVGPALFWPFMMVTALAGGVLALAVLLANRAWRTVAVRVIGMASGLEQAALPQTVSVPYGIAIAAGGLFAAVHLATS